MFQIFLVIGFILCLTPLAPIGVVFIGIGVLLLVIAIIYGAIIEMIPNESDEQYQARIAKEKQKEELKQRKFEEFKEKNKTYMEFRNKQVSDCSAFLKRFRKSNSDT